MSARLLTGQESPDFLTADEEEDDAQLINGTSGAQSGTKAKNTGRYYDDPEDAELLNGDRTGLRLRVSSDEENKVQHAAESYPADFHADHYACEDRPLLSDGGEEEWVAGQTNVDTSTYTVEDAVEHMGLGCFQLRLAVICGLLSATDALEMLLLSVLSPVLRCEWILTEMQVAFITTVVFVGMWVGSYAWGSLADKFGRHFVMFIGTIWILYFGILTAFSPNYYWILFLRSTVGFGFGGALQSFTLISEYLPSKHRAKILILYSEPWVLYYVCWTYVFYSFTLLSEYLPSTYRAKVLIVYNTMWAVGSCFEVWAAYFILPTWGWRWLVAVSALPTAITIVFLATLPESARFLLAAGFQDKATHVLEKASKMNGKTLPPGRLVHTQEPRRGSFGDLMTREYLRTTLSLWILWFGTAFSYYGMVLAQSEILEFHKTCGSAPGGLEDTPMTEECHCNLLNKDDYKQMIIATFGEFVVIPLNLLTIDYLGRKWTLVINYLGAGVFFLLIQLCVPRIVETMFMFGVRAFTAGIFNTIYIYTSEVYPTSVRSLGLGAGSAMARVGAMITPFIAQVLLQWSLKTSLWLYGGLCLICAVTAFQLPIETRGREMKQGQTGAER